MPATVTDIIEFFRQLLARLLRRKRSYPVFEAVREPIKVEPVYRRRARRTIHSRGQTPPFQPGTNLDLKIIQKRAANALFDHYHLPWIPPEFLQLLEYFPSPIQALRRFCYEYGVSTESLRDNEAEAIELFRQVVGMLLELSFLGDALPLVNRTKIVERMAKGEHESAEELLGVCQIVLGVLREAAEGVVQFPRYVDFVKDIDLCLEDCSLLSKEDAEDAQQLHETFKDLWMTFASMATNLDKLVDWLMANWPDNEWGEEHTELADDLVNAKEEIIERLRKIPLDPLDEDEGVPYVIMELQVIEADMLSFVDVVKASASTGWTGYTTQEPLEFRLKRWYAALALLEFPGDATPTQKEAKRKFRIMAMPHHHDRWDTLSPTDPVRIAHEEMFITLNNACQTLKQGKPTAKPEGE